MYQSMVLLNSFLEEDENGNEEKVFFKTIEEYDENYSE